MDQLPSRQRSASYFRGKPSETMVHVTEDMHGLEVRDDVSRGQRVVLFALGFIPLIAPYELLIRPNWQDTAFGLPLVMVLFISLGAVIISMVLFVSALAGASLSLHFDGVARQLCIQSAAPLPGRRTVAIPFDEIVDLRLDEKVWSEGEPTYALTVQTRGGRTYRTRSSSSKTEMEQTLQKIRAIIAT